MSNITISEKLDALDVWRWAISERIRHNMQTVSFLDLAIQRAKDLDSGISAAALEEVGEWFDWEHICDHIG